MRLKLLKMYMYTTCNFMQLLGSKTYRKIGIQYGTREGSYLYIVAYEYNVITQYTRKGKFICFVTKS